MWIGGSNESTYPHRISWSQFAKKADFNYDSTRYPTTVSPDLIIVGKDFWLERFNLSGYENWVYRTFPDIKMYSEGDISIKAWE